MDPGESIEEAVRREVFEETGVNATHKGIFGMREQSNYKNGASDFYMVCMMTPDQEEQIDIAIKDTLEVSTAKWIPLEDLVDNSESAKYP